MSDVQSASAPGPAPRVFPAIVRFLTDEEFRFRVLHEEETTLTNEANLLLPEAKTLASMNSAAILLLLKDELKSWGADIDKALQLMTGALSCSEYTASAGPEGAVFTMSSAAAYAEGAIHIRCPKGMVVQASPNAQTFDIIAHGCVRRPRIRFKHTDGTQVIVSPAQDATCSNDLFQHVEVQVVLDKVGTWSVSGTNDPANDDFDTATQNHGEIIVQA